jgi:hypothetical protein
MKASTYNQGDIVSLLWALDQDGPLRISIGNTTATQVWYIRQWEQRVIM